MYLCPTASCFLQGETKRTRQGPTRSQASCLGRVQCIGFPPPLICADDTLRYADDTLHYVRCVISALFDIFVHKRLAVSIWESICLNSPFHFGMSPTFLDGPLSIGKKIDWAKPCVSQTCCHPIIFLGAFCKTLRYQRGATQQAAMRTIKLELCR